MKVLAKMLETSEASVCRMEGGKQKLTTAMAKRLEKASGIWAGEFMFPGEAENLKEGKMAKYRATVVFPEADHGDERVLFDRPETLNAFALGVGMLLKGVNIKLEQMTKEGLYGPYRKEGK